jgi:antitoxin component YwqK of YwqJK toxin-antitoxin module
MKYKTLIYTGIYTGSLLLCASCQRVSHDVVSETYVHRYGVQLPQEDWTARGQSGQVVSVRKDGVVETCSYESGVLHGECTYTYPHREVVQNRVHYEQGSLAKEVENYPNGAPKSQTVHADENSSEITYWYENGVPKAHEIYQNGLLITGEYFTSTHEKESAVDDYHGVRVNRDPYGQIVSKDTIEQGLLTRRTTYHNNGAPQSITPYVNGKIEGQRMTYHPAGEPDTIETWVCGVQQGNTEVYLTGEKIADVPYRNGRKGGVERRYREGQVLVEQITWVQGIQHGPAISYVGTEPNTDWYFQGRKVSKSAYDALKNQ